MNKALFLDRDGVINHDYGYVYRINDFEFKKGIFKLVKRANLLNYFVIVVTNQAGIGRGYYSEEQFLNLNKWMIAEFNKKDCDITETFYCPFHPTEGIKDYKKDSFDRKPNPGLILKAAEKYSIDLKKSILIGDKISDIKAGIAAKIPNLYYFCENEKYPGAISINNFQKVVLN